MKDSIQIVFCTCPSPEIAQQLAHRVVEKNLAACVNIIANIKSIYRWEDKIETAAEQLLIIKTTAKVYAKLETLLRTEHPYEVPEILAFSVNQGLPDYIHWLLGCIETT